MESSFEPSVGATNSDQETTDKNVPLFIPASVVQ
jgi:hypothetical protein